VALLVSLVIDMGRQEAGMRVSEVMVMDVTVISGDTTVDAAAQIMADFDVSALVVGDEQGAPEGIITDRDILLRVVAPRRDPRTTRVGEVMSGELFCCRAADDTELVRREMELHQVRRMPVLDAEGRMIGMVTDEDLARARAERSSTDGQG
jgi:CBS domain-containing protein